MSRILPIPPQIGIVVGFDLVGKLNRKWNTIGVLVLVHRNLTQWAMEMVTEKGARERERTGCLVWNILFEVGMRNKLFKVGRFGLNFGRISREY